MLYVSISVAAWHRTALLGHLPILNIHLLSLFTQSLLICTRFLQHSSHIRLVSIFAHSSVLFIIFWQGQLFPQFPVVVDAFSPRQKCFRIWCIRHVISKHTCNIYNKSLYSSNAFRYKWKHFPCSGLFASFICKTHMLKIILHLESMISGAVWTTVSLRLETVFFNDGSDTVSSIFINNFIKRARFGPAFIVYTLCLKYSSLI